MDVNNVTYTWRRQFEADGATASPELLKTSFPDRANTSPLKGYWCKFWTVFECSCSQNHCLKSRQLAVVNCFSLNGSILVSDGICILQNVFRFSQLQIVEVFVYFRPNAASEPRYAPHMLYAWSSVPVLSKKAPPIPLVATE